MGIITHIYTLTKVLYNAIVEVATLLLNFAKSGGISAALLPTIILTKHLFYPSSLTMAAQDLSRFCLCYVQMIAEDLSL